MLLNKNAADFLRQIGPKAAVALLYYFLAKVSFIFDFSHSGFSPIWLPLGFGIAIVLMKGRSLVWGIGVGAMLAHATVFIRADLPAERLWMLAASLGFVNALQVMSAVVILKRFLKKPYPLFKVSDVFVLALAACVSAFIGAVLGTWVSCVYRVAPFNFFDSVLFNWWWADFAGILIVAPIVWIIGKTVFKIGSQRKMMEGAGWLIALIAISWFVFGGQMLISRMNLSSTFLLFPLVVWFTYRLGHWAAMVSVAIVAMSSVWGTANGYGPFVSEDLDISMMLLRFFNAVVALTALTLAAALYERQQAQLELDRTHQRFKVLIENSFDAVILLSHEGLILYASNSVERLIGYSPQENIGRSIFELVYPDDRPRIEQEFGRILNQPGEIIQAQCRLMLKGGSVRWFEGSGQNLLNDPTMQSIVVNFRDITERKMVEELLKMDKDALQRLVEERSEALAQTQDALKQANRLADIGTLAATVAHELRNPLGVIQIAVHNLKRKHKQLVEDQHVHHIETKVWEGNQIIDNLLSYSRIKMPSFEMVNAVAILDECVVNAKNRFSDKVIDVVCSYGANDFPDIEADPNQLREIFTNVLNNAFQAVSGLLVGQVHVDVLREGSACQFVIRDNGCGIAPADIAKVFNPFFTRKAKGTGLGLSICSEIINLHHGHINISSQEASGTTVVIALPIQQAHQ